MIICVGRKVATLGRGRREKTTNEAGVVFSNRLEENSETFSGRVPMLFINFEEIISRAYGRFKRENKVLAVFRN